MSDEIILSEYQDWVGHLVDEDALFIERHLAARLTHRREIRPDGQVDILNPNQYVGVLVLPSGRRIELLPKVPVSNVFYMMAVAHSLPESFRDELAAYDRIDEVLEFIADFFARLVGAQLDHGLYRAYVETEDNLSFVRGRVAVTEDVRHNWALRHRTYCRYSELTWDVPENQVILQTARFLSGWRFSRPVRLRIEQVIASLAEISVTRHPAGIFDRFTYHRFNDAYRPIHMFCRLLLDAASVSERAGEYGFQTFLLDMNQLFERYVTQVLRLRAAAYGVSVLDQYPMHLDDQRMVRMRPDIVVHSGSEPVLAADCKYKRLEAGEYKHHDLYQLLAYCTAGSFDHGVLIYPKHLVDVEDHFAYRNTDIAVRQLSLNLGGSPDHVRAASTHLADRILRVRKTDVTDQIGAAG